MLMVLLRAGRGSVGSVPRWNRTPHEQPGSDDHGRALRERADVHARPLRSFPADPLVKLLTAEVDEGLRHRFGQAAEARKHAAESVEKGRQYVAAYVDFMHYAERLLLDASGPVSHAEHGKPAEHAH